MGQSRRKREGETSNVYSRVMLDAVVKYLKKASSAYHYMAHPIHGIIESYGLNFLDSVLNVFTILLLLKSTSDKKVCERTIISNFCAQIQK